MSEFDPDPNAFTSTPYVPDDAEQPFNDATHPVCVVINRGGEITTVTASGTKVEKGERPSYGVTIDVHYQTEEGWKFGERLKFHKGYMYRWRTPKVRIKRKDMLENIWRD